MEQNISTQKNLDRQFATFYISERLFGIDVMHVQEITKALPMTRVPQAPQFVKGLINLRGQISTAIGLRELFSIKTEAPKEPMNLVCRKNDLLVSFLVDRIGDVIDVSDENLETTPDTISESIKMLMKGVYKIDGDLLSVLDVDKILEMITKYSKTNNM